MSRQLTNDFERQNINVRHDLSEDIDQYLRELEKTADSSNCLLNHAITPVLRARMVDWMIEVLTNFKCDD
jgi:cyclin B